MTSSSGDGLGEGDEAKVALVTGGARRLGSHLARVLSGLGYRLVINYLNSADEAATLVEELQGAGGSARAFRADVSSSDQVAEMVGSIRKLEGRLDLLVNNVGIYEPGPVEEMTVESWDRCIQTNLSGAFYCCHCCRDLLNSSGGQVINIGYAGVEALAGHPLAMAYQVSKTGLLVLTRSLAEALAPQGQHDLPWPTRELRRPARGHPRHDSPGPGRHRRGHRGRPSLPAAGQLRHGSEP